MRINNDDLKENIICSAIVNEPLHIFLKERNIIIWNYKLIEILIEMLEKNNLLIETIIEFNSTYFIKSIYNFAYDYINKNSYLYIILIDILYNYYLVYNKNNIKYALQLKDAIEQKKKLK